MSYRKIASTVRVGDRVWRDGRYWLVEQSTASEGAGWRFQLRDKQDQRTVWIYRRDFDVAVAGHGDEDDTTT
ncbi:hypothetical protein [Tsukamurella tyrosinosolvens]|uniref:hypothetical protein n=1 Tax=Tsukamurella tyrosinosolvens TaxID=57704 RepID=UPI002DD44736|nr:hypothetical protein [Tsukamurella tyrosinosolvens]MEC4615581.1 hypothetical protein [Tsukamurella tyrosinosolvens]